jgi:hypothetical protein
MTSFTQFGFGRDDDNVGGNKKRFKAQEGRRYRISFAWWKGVEDGDLKMDEDTCEFVGAPRNYIPGVGYIINRGPEYTKIAGDAPRMAIGTIIVAWPLDSKGNLDKAAIAAGDVDVCPWIFSQQKYKNLEPIHKEFHFGEHDVTITCEDTQYQKLAFSPCKDSILAKVRSKGGSLWESIVQQVAQVSATIQGEIGRELTLDQIREKMSGAPAGGASAPAAAVATEDIDNLVDNLLD